MRRLLPLVVSCVAVSALATSPPNAPILLTPGGSSVEKAPTSNPTSERATKPGWEWTADERLAARFDPSSVAERRQAYVQSHPQIRTSATIADDAKQTGKQQLEYSIDGHRNPELFLPHELFDALLSGLTPDEGLRALQRGYYREAIEALGYDAESFWARLASVSGPYLAIRFQQGNTSYQSKCEARFEALEAARRLFGKGKFERILYTVIAPTMQSSQATTLDGGKLSNLLMNAEKGCR